MVGACGSQKKEKLTIATASNMQFVISELIQSFTDQTGIECESIVSSSGKLTAQIMQGAPFDIFVSADLKYPSKLYEEGFTTGKPSVYAYGRLVLWSMSANLKPSIDLLSSTYIHHIALANPKTAPYGVAAIETLRHYNIYDNIESKLVYGESISQTNQFIISNAAEIGFTAKSVVLSPQMKESGHWLEVDPSIYSPIAQGVVLLNYEGGYPEKAKAFLDFILSKKGKEILNKFGYSQSMK